MSRSYKKNASSGICCGSNTKYYRERNKNTRQIEPTRQTEPTEPTRQTEPTEPTRQTRHIM